MRTVFCRGLTRMNAEIGRRLTQMTQICFKPRILRLPASLLGGDGADCFTISYYSRDFSSVASVFRRGLIYQARAPASTPQRGLFEGGCAEKTGFCRGWARICRSKGEETKIVSSDFTDAHGFLPRPKGRLTRPIG